MKTAINFKNTAIFLAYSFNFLFCLILFLINSISWKYLQQGALPSDNFFYLPLDELYLGVLFIAFGYHTLFTTWLSHSSFYSNRSWYLYISWFIDSALIFSLFSYLLIVDYISYYDENKWKISSIMKNFLLLNPNFYFSLGLYLSLNFLVYFLSNRKKIHA